MNYKSLLKTPGTILNPWIIPGLKNRDELVIRNPSTELKEKIALSVLTHYGLSREMVFEQKTRKREIVFARQLIMFFLKKYTKMSLKSVGQEFRGEGFKKGKDHTTVIYAIQQIKNLCDVDPIISREVKFIECKFI